MHKPKKKIDVGKFTKLFWCGLGLVKQYTKNNISYTYDKEILGKIFE